MYDPDKYKDKTSRARPSQARSKERVRVILAAALHLFKERGIEHVTTNDIAERAGVPIGSLYRYYSNKDAIIAALVELYAADISQIFAKVARHPMLRHLSWDEVLLLMVDGWVQYAHLNGSFALLYGIKANPRLFAQNKKTWRAFVASFERVLRKRYPAISRKDAALCFQLCFAAAEMGINDEDYGDVGGHPHYAAVNVIAAHMLRVGGAQAGEDDAILG